MKLPRIAVDGPKAWLGVLPAYAVLVGAVWLPQLIASHDMLVLAVLVGVAITAIWCVGITAIGVTQNRGLVGAGIGIVTIALTHVIGTVEFQAALALGQGRSLDGVTLADAHAAREKGIWIRLTDARVRSEVIEDFHFQSGGGSDGKGGVRSTTMSTVSVSPVLLASSVPREEPYLRGTPSGEVWLWACATSSFPLRDWDSQRQAVRGRLEPMEAHVVASLKKEIGPNIAPPIPGAGAIPAAPGAVAPTIPIEHTGMSLPAEPWCVHLDPALDAAAATAQAQSTVLAVGLTMPVFVALFVFLVVRTKP